MHPPLRPIGLTALSFCCLLAGPLAAQQFLELPRKPLYGILGTYQAVAAGDVDGDGDPDLVFGNADGVWRANALFLNDGRGVLQWTVDRLPWDRSFTYALALVDVDGDRDLDLVVGNLYQNEPDQRGNRLLRNDGVGRFTDVSRSNLPVQVDLTFALAAGDVDGDRDVDLLFGNDGTTNRLLLNDGTGTFLDATATNLPPDADRTSGLALADLDGDGDLDLVTANWSSNGQQNRLYRNDGRGRFTDETARLPALADPTWCVLARDLDGDGDVDLVFGNQKPNPQNRVLLNDGRGWFTDQPATKLPRDLRDAHAVACGDVDEDGHVDLLFGNGAPDWQLTLWLGDGRGGFRDAPERLPRHSNWFTAAALFDADGDQDLDLATGSHGPTQLFVNLARQAEGLAPPRLGTTWHVGLFARASFAPPGQVLLPYLNLRETSLPIPPLGTWRVDPAGILPLRPVSLPTTFGAALLQLAIPADGALAGIPLVLQGVALHDASYWRFTNVVHDPIQR